MTEAWHVIRAALRDTAADVFTTAVVNLLWLFLSLLVVTGPPATVALFYVGNRIARGEPTDVRDFLAAFRRYFGVGWRWGLVNLFVIFFLAGDAVLTGRLSQSNTARFIQGLYITALVIWFFLQLYVLSFLFEQEKPVVRQAVRNAAVMLGANISFSLALGVFLVIVLSAGAVLFLITFAVGGVFVALVGNHAVLDRLATRRAAGEKKAG